MTRRQSALALLAAVLSSAMTFVYLARVSETQDVVVAVRDVPACDVISVQSVRLASVSRQAVHPDAYTRCEDIIGKYAVQALVEGEQVLRERVAAGQYGGIVAGMSPEMRAMFIPVEASKAVGGQIGPGSRVDVVCVSGEERSPGISRCVLKSLSVVSAPAGGGRPGGIANECSGVVVAVTPVDAERLAFCLEKGHVYLTAVPFGASGSSTPGAVWGDVFDQAVPAVP